MKSPKNQAGFSQLEAALVIAVIVVAGLVGYRVYSHQQPKTAKSPASTTTNQNSSANDVANAPAINSTNDLTQAEKSLDRIDIDSSNTNDTNQLDAQLTAF